MAISGNQWQSVAVTSSNSMKAGTIRLRSSSLWPWKASANLPTTSSAPWSAASSYEIESRDRERSERRRRDASLEASLEAAAAGYRTRLGDCELPLGPKEGRPNQSTYEGGDGMSRGARELR